MNDLDVLMLDEVHVYIYIYGGDGKARTETHGSLNFKIMCDYSWHSV